MQAPDADTIRPVLRPDRATTPIGRAGARDAASLDRTTASERQAALAPPATRTISLGETLAALGNPTEQGFWLRTGLVQSVRQGRVEVQGGKSVAVELRPSGEAASAGSQLSLAAFRALEVPLTQLVNVRVMAE
ncbi:MAG: D-galactarate dehydratase [Roseinatronobacter sp.]